MSILDRFRGHSHDTYRDDEHDGRHDSGDVVERRPVAAGREHQREEFGGTNWGAAFFGWLVAIGLGALLTALLSAAGTAIGFAELDSASETRANAETITLIGGIALLVVALVAYFAGGYVAGRMSRFDGGRQGLAVWILSIVFAVILAVLGAIAGSEYNLFQQLNLPRIPIDEGDLTTGAIIALVAIVVGTALAAIAGGKAGERYHRRVDRAGYEGAERERVGERSREHQDARTA